MATSTELERREAAAAPATLFGTRAPTEIVKAATDQANALKDVIEKNKLYVEIGTKRHVYVQGWTFLGSMLGVYPVTVWTRQLTQEKDGVDGWEARVEARTRAGEVVGGSEAMCTRDEEDKYGKRKWEDADHYALRSMAQTRATSKALRQPLDFVMQLAGFDSTPAEEIPPGGFDDGGAPAPAKHRCPGCGKPTVVKVNSKKENAPKWKCESDDCTGGSNNRSWASWEEDPFGVTPEDAEAAGNDDNVRAILEAVQAGEITKGKVVPVARRLAKAANEPQITDVNQLGTLSAGLRAQICAELLGEDRAVHPAEVVEEGAQPASQPQPAAEDPDVEYAHCAKHDSYDPKCPDCRWANGEPVE